MDMRNAFEKIVSDLVAIPSPSGKEEQVSDYVFECLRREGCDPCRDSDGNVWTQLGPSTEKILHLNCHLDTVVPGEGWETDPWCPVVKGDLLFGLGSSDCKGGVAAMLLLAPMVRPKVRTLFSFTVCEEGGGKKENGSRKMAARGGTWAVTVEPSCAPYGVCASVGTQGHALAVVRFAGKSAHSSRPELGENAVSAASRFILAVDRQNGLFKEAEVYPGVCARPSVAVTLISGGRLSNVIPDSCEVTVSRRLAPGETEETFRRELDALLAGEKASYEVRCDGPCAVADTNGILFSAVRRALKEVTGQERFGFQRGRTDAVIYAGRGMDTITLGPGQSGQSHCPNEHINLTVAEQCVRVLEHLVNELA